MLNVTFDFVNFFFCPDCFCACHITFLLYCLAKLIAASDTFIIFLGINVTEFKRHISMCCVCSLPHSHSVNPILYPHLCQLFFVQDTSTFNLFSRFCIRCGIQAVIIPLFF